MLNHVYLLSAARTLRIDFLELVTWYAENNGLNLITAQKSLERKMAESDIFYIGTLQLMLKAGALAVSADLAVYSLIEPLTLAYQSYFLVSAKQYGPFYGQNAISARISDAA